MEKNNYLRFEEGLGIIDDKGLLQPVQIISYPSPDTTGMSIMIIPMKKEYITVRYGDDNE